MSKRTDICSFAAYYFEFYHRQQHAHYFKLGNIHQYRPYLRLASTAGDIVSPLASYFFCGEVWRILPYCSHKFFCSFMYELGCNVCDGVTLGDLCFKIVRRRGRSQHHRAGIFFFHALELVNLFRVFADTYNKESCGKRVKRTCVPDLNEWNLVSMAHIAAHFIHHIKRCPCFWFVDKDSLPVVKIVLSDFAHAVRLIPKYKLKLKKRIPSTIR